MRHRNRKSRLAPLGGAVFSCLLFLGGLAAFLVWYPDSPLPDRWNPTKPLLVSDPVTPLTARKLRAALSDNGVCVAVLSSGATFDILPDLEQSENCHIRGHVSLNSASKVTISPVKTRCQVALRTAMWLEHGIKPAARDILDQDVAELRHLSSYNCRAMRTGQSGETRMSTHATAEAIDVTGVVLEGGTQLTLLKDWTSPDEPTRKFLRAMRDTACIWFRTTLGPDYNALHADHFHLQHTGWGTCR